MSDQAWTAAEPGLFRVMMPRSCIMMPRSRDLPDATLVLCITLLFDCRLTPSPTGNSSACLPLVHPSQTSNISLLN